MKSQQLMDTLAWLMSQQKAKPGSIRMATMIQSAPGVGKSSIVHDAGRSENVPVVEFRPANHGIEDLIGLPQFGKASITEPDGKKRDITTSTFATPDWLPREDRDGKHGILFLDELAQAQLSMQNALTQIILDHKMHQYVLPKGWIVVCASNRSQDRAGTNRIPSQLNNRLRFVDLEFSLNDWVRWAHKNKLRQELIAFAKFKPNALESFDPNEQVNCTPRSLADCDQLLGAPEGLQHELLSGTVSKGWASELLSFVRVWKELPTIDDIMKNPDKAPIAHDKPDVLHAVQNMLSMNIDVKRADHIDRYIKRLPAEYQTAYYKDALNLTPDLEETEAFDRFISENQDLLFGND